MKKYLFIIAAFTLIVVSSSSCKVVYPVKGLWIGTAVDGTGGPSAFYGASFFADGTVLNKAISSVGGAVYYSGGTWTLSGDTIKCMVTSIGPTTIITQTQTFIYSKRGRLTSGSWTDISGNNDYGTFSTMTPASK
jgi:hypothetical protein